MARPAGPPPGPGTAPGFSADALYGLVEAYAGFGDHHTGTAADARTTAWLTGVLHDLGASVREDRFGFERFVCEAQLRVDGQAVPMVPVFYSAEGQWRLDDCVVVEVDAALAGPARGLDPHLDAFRATDRDAALVLAIDGPDDLPVQCNRVPAMASRPGRPAVIIPGNWADRVEGGQAELDFRATVEPGHSANLIATLGPAGAPAINITTPLTGWTPAGGERGTGLAVALAVATDLAADHHVTLSICSGHELDHIGLRHYLDGRDVVGQTVIHLGASVAAIEPDSSGPARLGDQRWVLTTATGRRRDEIERRASAANWRLRQADPWPGEGGTWHEAGASVLSFLGGFSLFHTTADTAAATTPEAVALAAEVAIDVARTFVAPDHQPSPEGP